MVAITEMTNWAVDLIDVHKTYNRRVHALRGVSMQVGRGEIFGLLGPNGAGKSTLVKIMMTVVKPDRMVGTILGRPVGHRGKLARVGYLPENHRFPGYLTGRQLLDYYAALAKVPRTDRRQRVPHLLHRVGMDAWAHTRIDRYSKGMMQRLGLAQALMNDPELIVLDEPTDGLDPVGRRETRQLLLELRDRGKTVFLNSHLLSELEMVCDRVAILVNGMVARQGTLDELTEHTVEYHIRVQGRLDAVEAKLAPYGARIENALLRVPGRSAREVNAVIDVLRQADVLIESVQPHRLSLEDIFVEIVSSTAPGGGPQSPEPSQVPYPGGGQA